MKHNNELLKHIYKDASMATYTITTLLEDLNNQYLQVLLKYTNHYNLMF